MSESKLYCQSWRWRPKCYRKMFSTLESGTGTLKVQVPYFPKLSNSGNFRNFTTLQSCESCPKSKWTFSWCRGIDTLVLFDPMSHSKQSYVAIVSGILLWYQLTSLHPGTLALATMGLMESKLSPPNTAAMTFAVGWNSVLCRRQRRKRRILVMKM